MEMSQSVTFPSFSGLFQFQRFILVRIYLLQSHLSFSKYEVIKCNIFVKNGRKLFEMSALCTSFLYISLTVVKVRKKIGRKNFSSHNFQVSP